jgi:hypothetical protein
MATNSPTGYARTFVIAGLMAAALLLGCREASANAAMVDAANTANAGLSGCSSNTGKALYECVAGVLDRLAAGASGPNVSKTRAALQSAAAGLRAATSKAQALSAISACRSAIAGALRQVRAIGGKYVEGWGGGQGGGAGLEAIVGVLSKAAALIQSKG